jgi:hypothetical protein
MDSGVRRSWSGYYLQMLRIWELSEQTYVLRRVSKATIGV